MLRLPTLLAILYAVYASVFVLLLAVLLPPIQGPDEGAHFVRADQISRGHPFSRRLDPLNAGGVIDLGVMDAVHRFYPIVIDTAARVRPGMYTPIAWGEAGQWSFPNTAVYPPVFYLPAAIAIFAGKHLRMDVLHTEIWARVAQGVVSVVIAAAAISLSGPAAIWLFALLLLPSSAALMGSLTQDGPLLACAAFAAACILRLEQPREQRVQNWYLVAAATIIALLGMSRPPYAALSLLILAPSAVPFRTKAPFLAAAWLASFAWWIFCALDVFVSVDQSHTANAGAQLHYLLSHTGRIPALVEDTMSTWFVQDYAGYFITTFAPHDWYNTLAWLVLAYAATATILSGTTASRNALALTATAIVAATAGIFLLQYLTWTPVGGPTVLGVLGRYFLPMAALIPVAMTSRPELRRELPPAMLAPVFLFPVLSMLTTIHHLLLRYYL